MRQYIDQPKRDELLNEKNKERIRTWHQLFDVLLLALKPKEVLAVGLEASEPEVPVALARGLLRVTDAA